jgi:large subunit ribosomal protein L25
MSQMFIINATPRSDLGKGASRRLRRANQVPGIVYGIGKDPKNITMDHNALRKLTANESFYSNIITLDIAGRKEKVVLKDLQRHPFKPAILHLDLQRISETEKIIMRIPIRFTGADVAPAVKISGGLITRLMSEVEVSCLPKDLPEHIEIDLSKLELNQTIHLSNLQLPDSIAIVALLHGEDKPIAAAYMPRAATEETAAPVSAEVPVISKGAKEEGAAEGEGGAKTSDKKGK